MDVGDGADYVNASGVYGTRGTAAANNTPGARRQPIAWTDASGNFWLFGGNSAGNVAMLNDLWEYSPPRDSGYGKPALTSWVPRPHMVRKVPGGQQ